MITKIMSENKIQSLTSRNHYEVMNHYLTSAGFVVRFRIDQTGVSVTLTNNHKIVLEVSKCQNLQAAYEEITDFVVTKAYEKL